MKQKNKISKEILILDLVEQYPKLAKVLVEKYGFHCIGCMAAGMETIEQGAEVHGMTTKEVEKMIKDLNSLVAKDEK